MKREYFTSLRLLKRKLKTRSKHIVNNSFELLDRAKSHKKKQDLSYYTVLGPRQVKLTSILKKKKLGEDGDNKLTSPKILKWDSKIVDKKLE